MRAIEIHDGGQRTRRDSRDGSRTAAMRSHATGLSKLTRSTMQQSGKTARLTAATGSLSCLTVGGWVGGRGAFGWAFACRVGWLALHCTCTARRLDWGTRTESSSPEQKRKGR